jgi:mannosyltransferase
MAEARAGDRGPRLASVAESCAGSDTAALWGRSAALEERAPWAALLALTLLAALLRAIGLDSGLWLDEIRTLVDSVRHPLAQIVTVFPGNNQHTLYAVLAHLSILTFGDQPWSLRLPALLFGAATPAMLYFLAREFTGRGEGLLAALLLAVSYHHVWFSQNARGYSALAFFVLLSSYLLLRGLRRGRGSDFAWYALSCALGAYTHLTMAFVVAGHAIACLVLFGRPTFDRRTWVRWRLPLMGFALALLITIALYAPLVLDVQQFYRNRTLPPDVANPRWALRAALSGLELGAGSTLGALAAAALLACGLVSYYRQSRALVALFVLPGLLTLAAVLALRQPIFPRFLFFLSGFAVLTVVRGALEIGAWLTRRLRPGTSAAPITAAGAALVALMAVASAASLAFDYRYPKQDFAGAMNLVQAKRAQDEPVLTADGATYAYGEYYHLPWAGLTSLEQLREARAQGRRVWMVYTFPEYVEGKVPGAMSVLRDQCAVAGIFRGTVAGGDVVVCTLSPARSGVAVLPLQ